MHGVHLRNMSHVLVAKSPSDSHPVLKLVTGSFSHRQQLLAASMGSAMWFDELV
jgi:hypothetical protein